MSSKACCYLCSKESNLSHENLREVIRDNIGSDQFEYINLCDNPSCSVHTAVLCLALEKRVRGSEYTQWGNFYNCAVCGIANPKSCGGCMQISYCSKECQIADRKLHKKFCTLFSQIKPLEELICESEMIDIILKSLHVNATAELNVFSPIALLPSPLDMTREKMSAYFESLMYIENKNHAVDEYYEEISKRQKNGTLWIHGHDKYIGFISVENMIDTDAHRNAWNYINLNWSAVIKSLWRRAYENDNDIVVSHYTVKSQSSPDFDVAILISKKFTNTFFLHMAINMKTMHSDFLEFDNAYAWLVEGELVRFEFDWELNSTATPIDWRSGTIIIQ